jgi:hypothetical protein
MVSHLWRVTGVDAGLGMHLHVQISGRMELLYAGTTPVAIEEKFHYHFRMVGGLKEDEEVDWISSVMCSFFAKGKVSGQKGKSFGQTSFGIRLQQRSICKSLIIA